ncbi:MAG TPA: hypothetical protein VGM37_04845 [Armatimonadota bacterium]|jgi:hypothetical protein
MRALWGALALLAIGIGRVRAEGPITLRADACFNGMTRSSAVYPVSVALRNTGPSVDGQVVITVDNYAGSRRYVYPCPLPTGSVKRILAYPKLAMYSDDVTVAYTGDFRGVSVPLSLIDTFAAQVGLISDHLGGLTSLRNAPRQNAIPSPNHPNSTGLSDCYCTPENAPDRAPAYCGLSVLALADGAERMNAAQWAAIRRWALLGGRVMLLGGAGGGWMNLPEAQALCPLSNVRGADVARLDVPGLEGFLPDGPAAIQTGVIKPGSAVLAADRGRPVLTSRPLGAGMVLCVGFNPLEKAFRARTDQADLWRALIGMDRGSASPFELGSTLTQTVSRYTAAGTRQGTVNPFSVKMPPAGTIAWMFAAYFMLVIPVTYVALKRIRRLEWAWVTSPLISFAFVGVLHLFTADLYRAGTSHHTRAIIAAESDSTEAAVLGVTEVFFQRSGDYRIEAPRAESLELSGDEGDQGYRGPSARQPQPLETVDTGAVFAPSYGVSNLSFRRFFYSQPISLPGSVHGDLRMRNGWLEGTLHNGAGYALTNASLYLPQDSRQVDLGDIRPGETALPRRRATETDRYSSAIRRIRPLNAPESGFTRPPGYGLLIADIPSARVGPVLGRKVGGPGSVTLVVSVPVEGLP